MKTQAVYLWNFPAIIQSVFWDLIFLKISESHIQTRILDIAPNGLGISAGGAKEAKTFYKHQTEQKTFSAD